MAKEYVRCAVCGRTMIGRAPALGDGAALFPYRHKAWGEPCEGRYFEGEILPEDETKNFTQ